MLNLYYSLVITNESGEQTQRMCVKVSTEIKKSGNGHKVRCGNKAHKKYLSH